MRSIYGLDAGAALEPQGTGALGSSLEGEPEGGFEETDQSEVNVWTIVDVLEPYIGTWDAIG